jgi:hypothetical protein
MELARQRFCPHDLENRLAAVFIKIGQRFRIKVIAKKPDQRTGGTRWHALEKVRLVSRVKRRNQGTKPPRVARLNGVYDRRLNLGRKAIERRKTVTTFFSTLGLQAILNHRQTISTL